MSGGGNINIITTKTLPPQKRGRQARRHNEQELLAQISGARLCSVVAPPGYGKTNILALGYRHLNALGYQVAWLSLDSQDNEFYRFLSYFLVALQQASGIRREWRDLLLETQLGDPGDHLLSSLIDELSDLDAEVYLILDDFHHINDRQINAFICRLIAYAPSSFHLIIGSRRRLEMNFYRDIQNDQYVEIGHSQLQLSLSDTQRFFTDCCDLRLPPEDIERWHRETEGWVFPLKLASISMKQRPGQGIDDMFQGDRSISEYLSDEVLDGMSKPFSSFMMAIAVPDIFSVASASYIAGVNDADELLKKMFKQNLFIERLSTDEEWYQLHPFFRSYLEARLRRESPGQWTKLHRKAREWFEQNGMPNYAIKHAIDSGDSQLLGELLEKSCYDLLINSQYMELMGWARILSDDDIMKRPKLCFAVAFNSILVHQFSEGRQLLASLVDSASVRRKLGEFSNGLPVLLGMDAAFRDDVDDAMQHCLTWYGSLNSGVATPPLLLITGCNVLSYGHLLNGNFGEALDVHFHWKDMSTEDFPAFGLVYASCLEGMINLHRGDIAGSERGFAKARDVAEGRLGFFSIYTAFSTAFQAEIRYQKADARFLLEEVFPCLNTISQIGMVDSLLHAYPAVAAVLYAEGRQVEAGEVLDRAESVARLCDWPRLTLACLRQRLRFSILAHSSVDRQMIMSRVEKIEKLSQTRGLNISGLYFLYMIKAENLSAVGRYKEAISIIEDLRKSLKERGFSYLLFLSGVNLAFLYAASGDNDKMSSALMAECIDYASSEKLVQAFVDASYLCPGYWKRFRASLVVTEHDQFLLLLDKLLLPSFASNQTDHRKESGQRLEEFNLSERELEVLELIGQGLTNKHIARSLNIAHETVKWHIKNIFGKLEVNSRVNAVQKSRQFSLIS
jgi:LuxR family transcriptional regulator, maltose regulon positive regulatory protein